MEDLNKLQEQLKEIILNYEQKACGKIDNRNQIKQFNALVRNEGIDEELINFIIDVTDEINTRHFEFAEHTIKAIKDMSGINNVDIEKLKKVLEKLQEENDNLSIKTKPKKKVAWYDISKWSMEEAKFFLMVTIAISLIILIFSNADNEPLINALLNLNKEGK